MSVKMIAVDMDGTFLNSRSDYNRNRFVQLYQKMKEKNIHFVVASGNQYYQLKSFFPDIADEIAFVAENGALVVNKGEVLYHADIDRQTATQVLDILHNFTDVHTILCGKDSAYVNSNEPDSFINHGLNYYHRLKKVPDLYQVQDSAILKFALSCPVELVSDILQQLADKLGDKLVPVSSGHGDIDLILPGIHKARGLQVLQDLWHIDSRDIAAFGDSGNDYEMLKHVGYGFAMGNATNKIKAVAKQTILTNDQDGVLTTIEQLI